MQAKPLLLALGFVTLAGAIGIVAAQLLFAVFPFLPPMSLVGMCASFMFGFVASFGKVQDEY